MRYPRTVLSSWDRCVIVQLSEQHRLPARTATHRWPQNRHPSLPSWALQYFITQCQTTGMLGSQMAEWCVPVVPDARHLSLSVIYCWQTSRSAVVHCSQLLAVIMLSYALHTTDLTSQTLTSHKLVWSHFKKIKYTQKKQNFMHNSLWGAEDHSERQNNPLKVGFCIAVLNCIINETFLLRCFLKYIF